MSTSNHRPNRSRLVKRVHERDDDRCQHCDRRSGRRGRVELRVRHVVPKSRGGTDHPRNLVTLCRNCHEGANEHHVIGSADRITREIVGGTTSTSSGTGGGAVALVVVGGVLLPLVTTLLVLLL